MALTTLLKQMIPEKFVPILGPVYRYVTRLNNRCLLLVFSAVRNNREFVNMKVIKSLRSELGEEFDSFIDCRDEMYHVAYDDYTKLGIRRGEIQRRYFRYGKLCRDNLKDIMASQGKVLERVASLLEFPSGYGRVTRFLVTQLSADKITVSDIDLSAVSTNSKIFRTQPLVSSENPTQFVCDQTFEIILVSMLFSHFNIELWRLWLERLYVLLEPEGLLIFSTLGPELLKPEEFVDLLTEDGFWFSKTNETKGRLNVDVYGTTWVSDAWVRKQVKDHDIGELCSYFPKGLAEWQDVYVIKRPF